MIKIMFYGGTHGNYVEFVLNRLVYGDKINFSVPYSPTGTCHQQRKESSYQQHRHFACYGAFHDEIVKQLDCKESFIKIDFDASEDCTVFQLNLKRGEDYNIDPVFLHENTYFKLSGKYGPGGVTHNGPDKIIDCINQYLSFEPYENIKDPSWPEVTTIEQFYALPKPILDECINIFDYKPVYINKNYPDAPSWVLRSIFKSWFHSTNARPSKIMSMFDDYENVYKLPLRTLYDPREFEQQLVKICEYFNLNANFDFYSKKNHKEYIDKVPYKNSKSICQTIIQKIFLQEKQEIGKLNFVEQAYIDFTIESEYNIIMPDNKDYFVDTGAIIDYIKQKKT